ncbi:MAG: hypothetical protein D6731_01340 [Planctomycetota bacterium]|nr:MAG: hypothetical protein D6731_01340 [Planctomycetota bacterium]
MRRSAAAFFLPLALLSPTGATAQEGLPLPPGVPGEVLRAEAEPSASGVRTHRFVVLPRRVREHLERNAARYRRGAADAVDLVASPVFAGAILASELARGIDEGDPDKPGDVAHMVNTPEFYSGIAAFNLALRAGDGAWNTAAKAAQRAGLGRVAPAGTVGRISSRAVGALRSNLVLAVALTLPHAVRVDFGGATLSQVIKGDLSQLDVSVRKGEWTGWDELAITLGSFAVAGPPVRALVRGFAVRRFAFPGLKRLAGLAGRLILRRVRRTAAAKAAAAAAPIPGSRIAAGALTVGEALWAIGELGGVLFAAGKIEEPVSRWNDQRKMNDELRAAVEHLLTVARDAEDLDSTRAEELRAELSRLREDLAGAYERMAGELISVAGSPIRFPRDGRPLDAAALRAVDPTELRGLHYVDLEFPFARARYEEIVGRTLDRAAELLAAGGGRRALEALFEQMYLELGPHTVSEALGSMRDPVESRRRLTPEVLAGLTLEELREALAYENVRFPLTHSNFLSVPHRLAGENFQRVVQKNAERILALHEEIHRTQQLLDPEGALDEAIVRVAQRFADKRDYLYLQQAIADETLLGRLRRWGERPEALGALVDGVLRDVGPWEALPGQTLALRQRYERAGGLPGRGAEALRGSVRRWLLDAQARLRGLEASGRVSADALAPRARPPRKKKGWARLKFWEKDEDDSYHLAEGWRVSDNRRQLFEQEQLVYREALRLVRGTRLRERLATEVAVVEALRSLDDELLAAILAPLGADEEVAEEDEAPRGSGEELPLESPGMVGALDSATGRGRE